MFATKWQKLLKVSENVWKFLKFPVNSENSHEKIPPLNSLKKKPIQNGAHVTCMSDCYETLVRRIKKKEEEEEEEEEE